MPRGVNGLRCVRGAREETLSARLRLPPACWYGEALSQICGFDVCVPLFESLDAEALRFLAERAGMPWRYRTPAGRRINQGESFPIQR